MNKLRLWYSKPAQDWNEALPFGNGRLGGMVFGDVTREKLQLNEDSVWYGGPRNRNNPDARKNLSEIRRLLVDGQIKEAEKLAVLAFSGTPESQRHYQPLGDLIMEFSYKEGQFFLEGKGQPGTYEAIAFCEYQRNLDLENALITVSYTVEGIRYTREIFSTAADQVIVMRLTADQPGKISFVAHFERERWFDQIEGPNSRTLSMTGYCGGEGGIGFCASVTAEAQGGRVYTLGDNLLVDKADSCLLILSGNTSFRSVVYRERCTEQIEKALRKGYEKLYMDHSQDYAALFNRVSLKLFNDEDADTSKAFLPTDERLERLKKGEEDLGLISLYFQFGRYLLISCSRPGSLPANLQGLWNKEFHPPWGSKYTININTQMNYWPAEVCNLSECHLPLFDHIERMREPGRVTAREMYGCRGFVAHHNTDIWGDTAPQDVWIPATYWPMGAAWLCLHLWEHYRFNPDSDFLRQAYSLMKEAAEFFTDFLIEDEKGHLITCPSLSPENVYKLENGESGSLCAGNAMDSQILIELFSACIQSAEILDVDEAFKNILKNLLDKLPASKIGRYGQIQEWTEDYEEMEPGHRHISQLFALYPGHQITQTETPELAQAARKTLERRLSYGGGHTGWSRAWIINHWARLQDAEKAYENVLELLKRSTLPNLFDNHPPFQIDGNFGGTAGIAEMLLQSTVDEIQLLPALPKAWTHGCVKGLKARGGFTIDLEWVKGKLTRVRILSNHASSVKIRYQETVSHYEIGEGQSVIFTA